ncbi:MAG: SPFH domain-containing protein [Treponema sp.]|nr:SPFH domain-containing protein [Treponema sp.]MCL2272596.1 SPFH domain-containing protein [Treponema sp.]
MNYLHGFFYGGLGIATFIILIAFLKTLIKVALPNRIMVVTGRKTKRNGKTFGFSVNRGRTIVIPYFQAAGSLDLDVFPINVRVEGVNSANGITVGADATACVCIDDDDEAMLYSAVERLMGKTGQQIHDQVQQTLVGNFRGALNKATPLQAIGMEDTADENTAERAQFRAELFTDINADLRSFGMKVVSVSLQKIWDTSNYIANLAQKTLAEKRQAVEIEESRLRAIAEQAESDSHRRIQVAKNKADEAIIAAKQELEIYRRESEGLIKGASITADQSIAQAANSGEAAVQKKLVELQKLKNQTALTLEAEALEEKARIIASGDQEAVSLKRSARNEILKGKAKLISKYGSDAQAILFFQEQLPHIYKTYMESARETKVDNFIIMNDEEGFSGAVNRGPRAFADFLKTFADTFSVDIKSFIAGEPSQGGKK